MKPIDYDALWTAVMGETRHGAPYSVHGPEHWRRVERNACILATQTGAVVEVVRLFALFHDSRRIHDGQDDDHGRRGADFAAAVRGKWFELPDEHFELLHYACVWHTDARHHADPTIGTCWDADRLDLGRVGIIPNPKYMSTALGAEIARQGTIQPWDHLAEVHLPPLKPRHSSPEPRPSP